MVRVHDFELVQNPCPCLDAQILEVLRSQGELSAREILALINDQSSYQLEVYHFSWSMTHSEVQGLIRSRYEKNLNPKEPNLKYYCCGDSM